MSGSHVAECSYKGIYSFYKAFGEKEMLMRMGFIIISNTECTLKSCSIMQFCCNPCIISNKPIPLQAWTAPEGFRSSKLPDFKTNGT